MNAPTGLLNFQDAYQLTTATFIVGFVTQAIQQLSGWNPKWIGVVVSLVTACLGVVEQGNLPWYGFILQVFIRACQLYCMAAGGIGLIAKRRWRKKLPITVADGSVDSRKSFIRPFLVRWY